MKTCTTCHVSKPRAEFCKKTAASDGLQSCCRSCASEYSKVWVAENPERKRKNTQEWRAANSERVSENTRKWSVKNRDRRREIHRKWKASNPNLFFASSWSRDLRRRIQKQGNEAPPCPTLEEVMKILDNLGDKCATCSGLGPFEVDHIIPLRLAPELVFEPSNLQRLCVPCHKAKTKSDRFLCVSCYRAGMKEEGWV